MKLIERMFKKKYEELTTGEIHSFVEDFNKNLPYFDYDYPNFLPHIVIALEKHP